MGGFLKATFIGAASGAVTHGIGTYAQTLETLGSKMVFQALAHGTSQSFFAGIQGGDMLAGFASGALSSIASSLWVGVGPDNAGWHGFGGCAGSSDVGMVAFGTVMSGAGAALTKGNFWQGAASGLAVSLLNHVAHRVSQDPPKAKLFKPDGTRDPLVRADGSRITNGDVNGDGKISLIELEYWYRNGNGNPINIKASSISLKGVNPNLFKGLNIGESVGVNLLFSDFWGEGTLYGELKLTYQGGNKVSISPNKYDFDVGASQGHPWFNSKTSFLRNLGTVLGNVAAGSGKPFMINFTGNASLKFNPNQ